MHHPSISAGGNDIDKLNESIARIDKEIGEADLKAHSNDPDERAFWRKRVESLQMLQNLMIERERKEAELIDLMLERNRQKASEIDGLIRLGKVGDNVMLISISKY